MKTLVLVLSLLLTTEAFAVSGSSSRPIGRKAGEKVGKSSSVDALRARLETIGSKSEELGLNVKVDTVEITKDMKPAEAQKIANQAFEIEKALEAKRKELTEDSQMRVEVEVVLQAAFDALTTRSEYTKALEAKEELKEKDDSHNLQEVLGILENALKIARAKVLDSENVSKDDMIMVFQTISGIGSGSARVIAQARNVMETIKNMGKTALEIRSCD